MRYTTLFGHTLDFTPSAELVEFHARLLEAGMAAEDLLYGSDNPVAPSGKLKGLPAWTAESLRSLEWSYLADAVARARAAVGNLHITAEEQAATMSVKEAALSLGVSEQSVSLAVQTGDLAAIRIRSVLYLDPRAVEAYITRRATPGRTQRVPALFARCGSHKGTALTVAVLGSKGHLVPGDLLNARDGAEERVWPEWREAVIVWDKDADARAVRVRPAHGRVVAEFALGDLHAKGRWEVIEQTSNQREAAEMLKRAKAEWGESSP